VPSPTPVMPPPPPPDAAEEAGSGLTRSADETLMDWSTDPNPGGKDPPK